jgi:hypothetical protein
MKSTKTSFTLMDWFIFARRSMRLRRFFLDFLHLQNQRDIKFKNKTVVSASSVDYKSTLS